MKIPLKYSFRNLQTRRLTTALTMLGVALVVFVFAAVLMMADSSKAGSKRRSARQKLSTSAVLFQKPVARPARYAAPSAVVSMSTGRTIGRSRISA